MNIEITDLSAEAQEEMLSQFRWNLLKGLMRVVDVPPQKSKKLAAQALVASGKLNINCTFRVGLRAEGEPKYRNPRPSVERFKELQDWHESIEIVDDDEELVGRVIARQEDDILIPVDTETRGILIDMPEDPNEIPINIPLQRMIKRATEG